MKPFAMTFLLMSSALICAQPGTADYNIKIHISTSRMVRYANSAFYQRLDAVIDGKKYELESLGAANALLMLGDYQARLVKEQHWDRPYDTWRVYEFLLPDKRKRQFVLVGQSE